MYCKKMDCFNCPYDDCVNDKIRIRNKDAEKIRYIKNREDILKKMHSKYEERKNRGLCTACGKKSIRGKTMCCECLTKMRNRMTKTRREKGILPRSKYEYMGLCKICGKKPMATGQKVCEQCLQRLRKQLDINRLSIDMLNHPFRKMNDEHFKIQQERKCRMNNCENCEHSELTRYVDYYECKKENDDFIRYKEETCEKFEEARCDNEKIDR